MIKTEYNRIVFVQDSNRWKVLSKNDKYECLGYVKEHKGEPGHFVFRQSNEWGLSRTTLLEIAEFQQALEIEWQAEQARIKEEKEKTDQEWDEMTTTERFRHIILPKKKAAS